jgi:hypothetical protein
MGTGLMDAREAASARMVAGVISGSRSAHACLAREAKACKRLWTAGGEQPHRGVVHPGLKTKDGCSCSCFTVNRMGSCSYFNNMG